MHDPRYTELSKQLVHYSVHLKKGERVLLDLCDTPEEMGIALIREARNVGALPYLKLTTSQLTREMLKGATEEQYESLGKHALSEMQDMDACILIRGAHNITEKTDVPSQNMALAMKHLRPALNWRISKTKWCALGWPNPSMAQLAGMSTEAFEDFYFNVCLLDYAQLAPAMNKLAQMMKATDKVHIVGKGTDLHFSIKGMKALASCGNYNVPDGEVFTTPVKNSVEGHLTYNCPTIFQGIAFDNIYLAFKEGKIIEAKAGDKTEALLNILNTDEGARFIGEFALGTNPRILHPLRDILFDEKIAGSFHFTPGQAYEEVDNGNRSQIHWDMVCIQRPEYGGGEIYFDDILIRKDGRFLASELACLNAE